MKVMKESATKLEAAAKKTTNTATLITTSAKGLLGKLATAGSGDANVRDPKTVGVEEVRPNQIYKTLPGLCRVYRDISVMAL